MMSEFDLIHRYFAPLASGAAASPGLGNAPGLGNVLGLRDDAALLTPPPGEDLVLTLDTIVAGVHYLPDDPPETVAQKLLRVNLSDLAAMGARPLGYLMSTSLARGQDESWIAGFARGLAADQAEFGIALLGGDTTRTPGATTLSLTAVGAVPAGRVLRRGGARPGDAIYVSGTLGEATVGLDLARGLLPFGEGAPGGATLGEDAVGEDVAGEDTMRETAGSPLLSATEAAHLIARYRQPTPRLALGQGLLESGLATAALDVSDGLVADLGHMAAASGVTAEVRLADIPISAALYRLAEGESRWLSRFVTGGDDYELVFAAPPDRAADIAALAARLGVFVTRIGTFQDREEAGQGAQEDGARDGAGVVVRDADGAALSFDAAGWTHF